MEAFADNFKNMLTTCDIYMNKEYHTRQKLRGFPLYNSASHGKTKSAAVKDCIKKLVSLNEIYSESSSNSFGGD